MAIPFTTIAGAVTPFISKWLEGNQDERQLEQQEKLQGLQLRGAKEMADYNQQKQLEMWQKTGYEAQKKQMEAAGLNPALMYGMGGGGGQSTGVPGTMMPSSSSPGDPNAGVSNNMAMMMMSAQKAVLESQAEKNTAEAEKIRGVDTEKTSTEIQSLTQGIENQKAVKSLTEAQTRLSSIQQIREKESLEDALDRIKWEAKKAEADANIAFTEAYVNSATRNQKIEIIKQASIAGVLHNVLTKAQTSKTYSDIKVNEAEINKMANEIQQKWREISLQTVGLNQGQQKIEQDSQRIQIQKFAETVKANYPSIWEAMGRGMEDGLSAIVDILTLQEKGSKQNDWIKKTE